MVTGCSRGDCVAAPRCPDCRHNFVTRPNELCPECADDFRCADCKNPARFAFAKQAPAPRVGELVCEYCFQDRGIVKWEAERSGVCSECGKATMLNANNICRDCFSGFEQRKAKCYSCHQPFTATYKGDTHCATCKEKCTGCGSWFSPSNRLVSYCHSCVAKLAKNICLGCGKSYRYDSRFTKTGYCSSCNIAESEGVDIRHYCPICKIQEVSGPEHACQECLVRKVTCKGCGKNEIYAAEWLCKSCKKNYAKQQT